MTLLLAALAMNGCATMRDGAAILMAVVPVVIDILIDAADGDFGAVAYPFLPG